MDYIIPISKKIKENLGEGAIKSLENKKAYLASPTVKKNNRYSAKNPKHRLWFITGYDLLQYNIVVKPYILRKYKIKDATELDILLYLFPIQYFTSADFKKLPLYYTIYSFEKMLELGYVEICIKQKLDRNDQVGGSVYTLSRYSIKIVQDYYEYLSGEKQLDLKDQDNPFKKGKISRADKMRQELMIKLKREVKTIRYLFRDSFY